MRKKIRLEFPNQEIQKKKYLSHYLLLKFIDVKNADGETGNLIIS